MSHLSDLNDKARALKGRRDALGEEIRQLAEKDNLTGGEETRWQRVKTGFEKLDAELDTLNEEIRAKLEAGVADGSLSLEPGCFGDDEPKSRSGHKSRTGHSTYRSNPWGVGTPDLGTLDKTELRHRAAAAIEASRNGPDDFDAIVDTRARDRIADACERPKNDLVAQWVLASSDPAYRSAFEKVLVNPATGHRTFTEKELAAYTRASEFRAAMAETSTHGTELVPYMLDPTIVLTNNSALNPFRDIAKVVTIATNTYHGVNSAGVTAEWIAEATEVADASPLVATTTIPTFKADGYIQASYELFGDTNIGEQVSMLFQDAKLRLEATAFAVGTGSGQPTGVVTAIQAVTASRVAATTNGAFGTPDVFALAEALPPRYQPNATWLTNQNWQYEIRKMAISATPASSTFWADLGHQTPPLLLGNPVRYASGMQSTPLSAATASNDDILVVGDFRNYIIVDRVGMYVQNNPMVLGANRRPTGEVALVAFWRVGAADVSSANAYRLLRV